MTAATTRSAVKEWLAAQPLDVELGLPASDDRLRLWRVALLARHNGHEPIGEVQVSEGAVVGNIRNHPDPEAIRSSLVGDDYERTTRVEERCLGLFLVHT